MNFGRRNQRRVVLNAETLESRELLNAHVPQVAHGHAHIAAASAHAVRQISGTLTGLAPYTSNPSNDLLGTDSYTASGNTTAGTASLVGSDAYSSTLINPTTYSDLYYAGDWTMTLSNGSTIEIAYVGSGQSPTVNGPYTSKIEGEAVGISGSLTGKIFAFKGSVSGNEVDNSFSVKFSLKR